MGGDIRSRSGCLLSEAGGGWRSRMEELVEDGGEDGMKDTAVFPRTFYEMEDSLAHDIVELIRTRILCDIDEDLIVW